MTNINQNSNPEEAVIDSNPETVVENSNTGDVGANQLLTITNLINRYLKDIQKTKEQLKEKRQIYNDSYQHDSSYHEAEEKVKEVNKNKNKIKEQITKSPNISQIDEEIRGLRVELKEMELSLSDYLKKYQEMTKATTFEDDEGELMEIVQTVKLKKAKQE